jgi:LemA protein
VRGAFIFVAIALVVLILIGSGLAGTYNTLVRKSVAIDAQWAQVENQLQRRYELIPGLVESVKGYQQFEGKVFTDIANARAKLAGAAAKSERVDASNQLEGALSRLLVVFERYPELKAVQVYNRFMDEFSGTANRITVERQRFNDLVRDLNQSVKVFPTVLFARLFGIKERAYFTMTNAAGQVITPDFTGGR